MTRNVFARNGRKIQEVPPVADFKSFPSIPANDGGPGNFPPAAAARTFAPANINAIGGRSPFEVLDLAKDQAVDGFFKVLFGEVTGVHVKGMLPLSYCDELAARFDASPFRKARKDGVPGNEWGATQFGKTPLELAKLAYEQEGNYRFLIGGPDNPIASFFRDVAIGASSRGLTLRPALFQGQPMVILRAVQWTKSSGEPRWLLKLHDDWAQTVSARNEGFEIQQVARLVAFNFYIKSKPRSGQLVAYDWQPTKADRERIGVVDSGYPYDDADIPAGTKEHVFEQSSGDLVLLDGSHLHGVFVGDDQLPGRLIVNCGLPNGMKMMEHVLLDAYQNLAPSFRGGVFEPVSPASPSGENRNVNPTDQR